MKTPAIRIMLDHLYGVAEEQGIDLLTNSTYCFVSRTVDACERGEEITFPERRKCADDLETLCFVLGINYAWLVRKAFFDIDIRFYDVK